MFIQVIPQWTSFSVEALTYFVGDSFRSRIKVWQLVEIPYGKKIIYGIVAEILELSEEWENFFKNFSHAENEKIFTKNENIEKISENFSIKIPGKFAKFVWKNFSENSDNEDFEMKSIVNIISEMPILSEYQIVLILRLAMKYILPIHKVLQIFLSEPILRRLEKYNFPLEVSEKFLQKNNFQIEKNFEKKFSKNPDFDFYIAKNDIISPEKILPFFVPNLVIIVPDDILLERFEKFFQKNENIWSEKITFYPSDTTETRRSQAFIDVYNKKSEIIIWTRRLLQYNLSAYDEIWYLEDSFATDYFHYPVRILYTDFLAHIVDSGQFSVKIFSSIPRLKTLSTFHFFRLHHF